MEVLSIGEKIKRARIYKGFTLKDLCNGKISVSKMSCIENNKVSLDQEVLEFIAQKLDVDIDYLKEDVEEQIIRNTLEQDKSISIVDFESDMLYNLEIAENYSYFNSAFIIMHRLFSYYLDLNLVGNVENILPKYYELYLKSDDEENKFIYNLDMGRFLYINKEYLEAINYYRNTRCKLSEKDFNNDLIIKAAIQESKCYLMLKNYEKANEFVDILLGYIVYITEDSLRAEIYHHVAIIKLRNNKKDFFELEDKANKCYGDNLSNKAESMYDYSVIFFELGDKQKALEYLKMGIDIYPLDYKCNLARFVMRNVCLLIENNEIEYADNYCEECLNLAIDLNNDELIEKTYYYKSLILCKQNNFISAEMYINLSLDVLTKFGKKQDIYNRYMEIGNMYYKIGAISDSLKYFSLAISLEKKI